MIKQQKITPSERSVFPSPIEKIDTISIALIYASREETADLDKIYSAIREVSNSYENFIFAKVSGLHLGACRDGQGRQLH